MIIGVTGKSGSGKTYFSDLLNKNDDFTVIHVDEIVHQILDNPYFIMTFIGKYGKQFMAKDYTINREELGRFLFEYANRIRVTEYNEFIYPWIEKEIDKVIFSTKKPVIIDWMHLPETKYFSKCEYKVLLKSSDKARRERVKKRDSIKDDYFNMRDFFSLEYDENEFDEVIINNRKSLNSCVDSTLRNVQNIGFYAGSFDPFTNGHLEVLKKASKLFDKIVVGIGKNPNKVRHYNEEEMRKAIHYTLQREGICAEVIIYKGLTLEAAKKHHSIYLIRGLRNEIDYKYEEEIATYNEEHSGIDTIYLRAGKVGNISSTLVRERLEAKEDIKGLVPESVYQYLIKKN